MTGRPELAVCAARFLLPNASNLALVRAALQRAPRCMVFIRRAHLAPSPANPFAWNDRAAMLHDALGEAERARVDIVPLREHWDDQRLLRDMGAAAGGTQPVAWLLAAEPPVDAEDLPTGWSIERVDGGDGDAQAAAWLEQLYAADDPARGLAALEHQQLPPQSVDFLRRWLATPTCATVRDDWRQNAHEKRQWSVAPYPVVLVTVDAVVRAGGHVLLIRRGRSPGRGLWALPGGFLEPREAVLHAAVRELVEETGLPLSMRQMRQRLRGVRIFDHPERSQRGRIITHTFFFDLGDMEPPRVQGADDAAAAQWVPVAQLPELEAQLHDDHFHMLDTFLGLLPEGAR
ncbi:MAG: NUDIX domain-containing protein [Ramlibacter sp.]